ncbi:hemoglobin/transferrin/lactoferrin receptor protein [Aminobacter aminovorans]|uniref:Probable TonB-dependent receptor HI_1217 n=2 Tax=Aminobacter aminovorans TaxID=83263 RepID=A0A380WSV3_AMIAI|nr:hemoglobin/transferrin/lactoferrin receptor protein [Aminobacter aminovorans]SUU91376.1 Probable TonB-dependent receptor HI_1217 precursor [Aminobacter aminovorans]
MRTALAFGSASMLAIVASSAFPIMAIAQTTQTEARAGSHDFNIPAKSLLAALADYTAATGIQVVRPSGAPISGRSGAVVGRLSPASALARLLGPSGLEFQFVDARTVSIRAKTGNEAALPVTNGSLVLDVIRVDGGGGAPVYEPYETAAPTAYIPQETIDRFRGSSPADMLRGTPGVMSGEARNGAGAIDVNIRGMQGMGRVAVTVDGASNAVTIYQGYQGVSNRTFVDPDLLGGISIAKGSDAASNGIAGSVAMRTLEARDIIKDGKNFGVRLKGGFGTNTSNPPPVDTIGGYEWPSIPWAAPQIPVASTAGMERPSLLKPTSGSGSAVVAYSEGDVDLIAGYAYRKQGNYHAGTNGPAAQPVAKGPTPFCFDNGICLPSSPWTNYYDNEGITGYRAGEEVLNTQLETKSWIGKGTFRFGDGQSVELGYTGFRSEAGDLLASRLTSKRGQPTQAAQTTGTTLDTGTVRYKWKPEENELVDLKANLWLTRLDLRNSRRDGWPAPRPGDPRVGSDSLLWGADATNASKLSTGYGAVDLTYGLSYLGEDTQPTDYTRSLKGWLNLRDGRRQEAAVFVKGSWEATDWLTLNGGLRYQHYWAQDRSTGPHQGIGFVYGSSSSKGGFSPSIGVTLEPIEGSQFYVNYSNAMRSPSIIETTTAFTMNINSNVRPERSSNWEIGTNLRRDNVFTGDDSAMLKFGYFDWSVKDYIAREWHTTSGSSGMRIHNIDSAHFAGLELSGRYEIGAFTAELAANYYTDVQFCRTASTCGNKSLYADYATNQVPPRYSVDLTLTQKLMDDALTIGGRVSHVGRRAVGHGDVTAQGASQFIALVNWKPYTLVDVFAEYKFNENLTGTVRIQNLTDTYYVDPLSLVVQPGPGRTFYGSLTASF